MNWIAEKEIREAINAGQFDDLPGKGKPLDLDTDFAKNRGTAIPYTILKNAGYLPMPLLIRKEIEERQHQARSCLRQCRRRTKALFMAIESRWTELTEFLPDQNPSKKKLEKCGFEFFQLKNLPSEGDVSKWKRKRFSQELAKAERIMGLYNNTIRNYRIKYRDLLVEIDRKIEELHFNCIQEEIRQASKFSDLLQMPPINISAKLKEFDSEFRTLVL